MQRETKIGAPTTCCNIWKLANQKGCSMMWAFQYGIPEFQKMSRKTIRNDCIIIYETKKEIVGKICLTTNMWRPNHQVAKYMIIIGHFIDA
ncbi:hypothetical protein Lal_00026049 [Lupinus albus]|nr:hypothetical protein Lal_00026049 [Lupinus albus]